MHVSKANNLSLQFRRVRRRFDTKTREHGHRTLSLRPDVSPAETNFRKELLEIGVERVLPVGRKVEVVQGRQVRRAGSQHPVHAQGVDHEVGIVERPLGEHSRHPVRLQLRGVDDVKVHAPALRSIKKSFFINHCITTAAIEKCIFQVSAT